MVEPVVAGAEAEEVVGVGGAVVFPVDDVVDLEPPALVTARDPAAAVAVLDEPADPAGDDVLGAPQVHRGPVRLPDDLGVTVAGQVAAQLIGQHPGQVRRGHPPIPATGWPRGGSASSTGPPAPPHPHPRSGSRGPSPPGHQPTTAPAPSGPSWTGPPRPPRPWPPCGPRSWSRSRAAFSAPSTARPSSSGEAHPGAPRPASSVPKATSRSVSGSLGTSGSPCVCSGASEGLAAASNAVVAGGLGDLGHRGVHGQRAHRRLELRRRVAGHRRRLVGRQPALGERGHRHRQLRRPAAPAAPPAAAGTRANPARNINHCTGVWMRCPYHRPSSNARTTRSTRPGLGRVRHPRHTGQLLLEPVPHRGRSRRRLQLRGGRDRHGTQHTQGV